LTVDSGPDDIGHTLRSFYRVVRPHTAEVIFEDIPPSGPINADKLSDCPMLTNLNGPIEATNCHPSTPSYG
jgi:hypothetical protein